MIRSARLVQVKNQLVVMSVVYQNGKIIDLNGPYQCVSEPGGTREAMYKSLTNIMHTAVHNPVVHMSDLPEKCKQKMWAVVKVEEKT